MRTRRHARWPSRQDTTCQWPSWIRRLASLVDKIAFIYSTFFVSLKYKYKDSKTILNCSMHIYKRNCGYRFDFRAIIVRSIIFVINIPFFNLRNVSWCAFSLVRMFSTASYSEHPLAFEQTSTAMFLRLHSMTSMLSAVWEYIASSFGPENYTLISCEALRVNIIV